MFDPIIRKGLEKFIQLDEARLAEAEKRIQEAKEAYVDEHVGGFRAGKDAEVQRMQKLVGRRPVLSRQRGAMRSVACSLQEKTLNMTRWFLISRSINLV